MWCCRMDFFDVPLPPIVSGLVCTPFHEDVSDRGEVLAWLRAHKRHLDGCQALGTVRFHRVLSFHLDFQLRVLAVALKMAIFV